MSNGIKCDMYTYMMYEIWQSKGQRSAWVSHHNAPPKRHHPETPYISLLPPVEGSWFSGWEPQLWTLFFNLFKNLKLEVTEKKIPIRVIQEYLDPNTREDGVVFGVLAEFKKHLPKASISEEQNGAR